MPNGELPFPIRGEGLRNWLRTAGQAIFTEFESGAEALDFLRLNGVQIRDADFYSIRREVLELNRYQERLLDYPDNQLVPLAWHVSDHGLELSRNFMYRFDVIGRDPTTGEGVTKHFAISYDRQLSPAQAKDILGAMIVGEEDFYEIEVEEIELTAALIAP